MTPTRRNILFSIVCVIFMAIVAVLFFYPDDIDGRVLQQHDMSQGLANGQEGKLFHEQTGETTRWTNSLFSGMPNFQISPSYSSSPMLEWIGKIWSLGLPSPSNLVFMMMLGFFVMGLCMKMRWYISLFGAIAWGFSTYFIIIIGAGHIWKFVTLAYIPPTLGGIVLIYRGYRWGGAALTALFGAMQVLSNHIQMTYYFCFVAAAIIIGFGIAQKKEWRRWLVSTAVALGASVLAFAANFASLYNTAKYSKETVRGTATEIVTPGADKADADSVKFDYITGWSYGGDEMLTLLVPDAKGGASLKPEAGQNVPLIFSDSHGSIASLQGDDALAAQQLLMVGFREYFGEQPMTNGPVYVGAFVLFLAILGCCVWKGPMKWCIVAVTALSMLLALGHNLAWFSHLFVDWFPFYSKFRTVSSILVIAEFTIPVLAMLCLCKMVNEPDFFSRHRRAFLATGGVLGFICLLLVIAPSIMGDFTIRERELIDQEGLYQDPVFSSALNAIKADRQAMVRADAFRSLLFLAGGMAICWLFLKRKFNSAPAFIGALTLLVLLDLFTVNKRYIDSASFMEPESEDVRFELSDADREILKDTAMNYRVADLSDFTGARTSYFHKSVGGYHAAKLTRYDDLITYQLQRQNQAAFDMLNTKYFMGDVEDEDGNPVKIAQLNPGALGNAWFVDGISYVNTPNEEMKALDTLDPAHKAVADKKFAKILGTTSPKAPGDTIFETTYAPNRLTYKAVSAKGGIAVFSEIFFPWGWQATIDGKPAQIGRVNYVLRAMRIPAGTHTIEMRFDPESLKTADSLSVAAVWIIYALCAAALAFFVLGYMRRKKAAAKQGPAPARSDSDKQADCARKQ